MENLKNLIAEGEVYAEGWRLADLHLDRRPLHAVTVEAFKLIRAVGFTSYVRGYVDRIAEMTT